MATPDIQENITRTNLGGSSMEGLGTRVTGATLNMVAETNGQYFRDSLISDSIIVCDDLDGTSRLLLGPGGQGARSCLRLNRNGIVEVDDVTVLANASVLGAVGVGTDRPGTKLDVRGREIRVVGEGQTHVKAFSKHPTAEATLRAVSGESENEVRNTACFGCAPYGTAFLRYNDIDSIDIDARGFVGIRTGSPSEELDVNGNARVTGNVSSSTIVVDPRVGCDDSLCSKPTMKVVGGYVCHGGDGDGEDSSNVGSNVAEFFSSDAHALISVSAGRAPRHSPGTTGAPGMLGIGTLNPMHALHVQNGDVFATGKLLMSSDARFKTDLMPITHAVDGVRRLQGYTFVKITEEEEDKKDDEGAPIPIRHRDTGLLAQDLEAVLPEAVHRDGHGHLSVAYGNMMGLIVEAIKELHDRLHIVEERKNGTFHVNHNYPRKKGCPMDT